MARNSQFELYKSKTLPIQSDLIQSNSPTSLAHFIGGDRAIKGPILNKPAIPNHGLDVDTTPTRSFLADPSLVQHHRVALPGMTPARAKSADDVDLSNAGARPSSPSVESPGRSALRNYTALMNQSSPNDKQQLNTASLNRLRSSNLVKQRLAWGEGIDNPLEEVKSNPLPSPTKRTSVLERFDAEAPETEPSSPSFKSTESRDYPSGNDATKGPALAHPTLNRAPLPKKSTSSVLPKAESVSPGLSSAQTTASNVFALSQPSSKPSVDTLKGLWTQPISAATYTPSSPTTTSSRPLPQVPTNRVALPGMTPAKQSPLPSPASPSAALGPRAFPFSSQKDEPKTAEPAPIRNRQSRAADLPSRLGPEETSVQQPLSPVETAPTPKMFDRPTPASSFSWEASKRPTPSAADPSSDRVRLPAFKAAALPVLNLKALLSELDTPVLNISRSAQPTVDASAFHDGSTTVLDARHLIFYSQETVFLVCRYKGSDGLTATTLIVWDGQDVDLRDAKRKAKVEELAQRYKTEPVSVLQNGHGEAELAGLLDGLTIRSGSRSTFDPSNTALYRVARYGAATLTHEIPLEPSLVASGFSYVLGLTGTISIWHGLYSPPDQRQAAESLARALGAKAIKVDEEAFARPGLLWQVLDREQPYANSALWRNQRSVRSTPLILSVDASSNPPVKRGRTCDKDSVSLVDTGLEIYVVVPPLRRGDKPDIAQALGVAEQVLFGQPRPVHCLVFPTLIPIDLQALWLSSDLEALNHAYRPSQLSCYSLEEARAQLEATSFARKDVLDISALPTGVAPDDLA